MRSRDFCREYDKNVTTRGVRHKYNGRRYLAASSGAGSGVCFGSRVTRRRGAMRSHWLLFRPRCSRIRAVTRSGTYRVCTYTVLGLGKNRKRDAEGNKRFIDMWDAAAFFWRRIKKNYEENVKKIRLKTSGPPLHQLKHRV